MNDPLVSMLEGQLAQAKASALARQPIQNIQQPIPAQVQQTIPLNLQQAIENAVNVKFNELKSQLPVAPIPPAQPELTPEVMRQAAFELFKSSLTEAELGWLVGHISKGSPGFAQYLTSDAIKTVVQLGFENYKSFLNGDLK